MTRGYQALHEGAAFLDLSAESKRLEVIGKNTADVDGTTHRGGPLSEGGCTCPWRGAYECR